jgi:V/A-type H+-transporting ATPase subunit E
VELARNGKGGFMAEELQSLIDRIQQDGVAKADAEARRIVAAANEQAAGIMRDAETRAKALLAQAEQEARTFGERADKALEQAARDVVLQVQEAVTQTLQALVATRVGEALAPDTLKQMLLKVVQAYCGKEGDCSQIDLLVSPADQKSIVEFFLKEYRDSIDRGVEIHADTGVVKGFRVSIENAQLHHDFTQKEIAAALGRLLRPRLAEIMKRAVTAA